MDIFFKKEIEENIEDEIIDFARDFEMYKTNSWLNILYLYGISGAITIIKELVDSNKSACSHEVYEKCEQIMNWMDDYYREHKSEIYDHIDKQLRECVIQRYEVTANTKTILETSWDFQVYVYFREEVELMCIGIEKHLAIDKFRNIIKSFDREMKQYIYEELLPHSHDIWTEQVALPLNTVLQRKGWVMSFIDEMNIDLLPESFWWRHLKLK